jgi:hypothetical protein
VALAEPALDQKTVEDQLCEYLRQIPQAAKGLGIRVQGGNVNLEDIQRIARERLFVKLRPIS